MTATALDRIPMPPSARLLGWRMLDHDAARSWVRIGFQGKPDFCNPAGFIQGGLLTAMLDDTMGPAVWIATDGAWFTASIDIAVSFLNPARPGPLIAEATVIQRGRTIAFLEAQLWDESGTLICRATSTARMVAAQQALK
ncbi:MAG: PaaI family thioesterase [Ferrovibrio sp.]|uniref:PaaI family thioesterase n=1 Tax=Ferrovibrio sp. TaxID=1917215 RepID=UPI002601C097|nr:PaaI family thioesterase [Ferrovibrio sp.]MCW0235494.1 PaaI family thioesterase [Ferrovibrio sp.]